jgi:O-acetyl-ADP-ribose deacetylase (regulator of RNase III)
LNIQVIKGDITRLDVDAIVNAANSSLLGGGGVDGAIHRAAGKELLAECRLLGGCKTGEAKITKGYNLKAKYIIHTVGPVYHNREDDAVLLESCYKSSMALALEKDIHSIAFPAISTGIYGYPKDKACKIAVNTIREYDKYDIDVYFVCFDSETYELYNNLI